MLDLRLYALTDPAVAGRRTLIELAARVADATTLEYALKRRETS